MKRLIAFALALAVVFGVSSVSYTHLNILQCDGELEAEHEE